MRAHQQIDRATRSRRQHPAPLLGGKPRMQHPHPQARLATPGGQGASVLLGQHLGGRHEQALPAGARDQQGRGKSHCGLAAAHVALKQALHGRRAGQIAKQRPDSTFLAASEHKG